MRIRLNYWQCTLLFIPFLLAMMFIATPGIREGVPSLLILVNILLVISYQAYLLISFTKVAGKNKLLLKVNSLIAVASVFIYLIDVLYLLLFKHSNKVAGQQGPMKTSEIHGVGIVIVLFLLHATITFLFINNQYVSAQIKRIPVSEEQEQLIKDYLMPMRVIVKAYIISISVCFLMTIVLDIVKFL